MNSLWYRLTSVPSNLDDCLDMAKTMPIDEVQCRLVSNQFIREQWLITQMVARFDVKFSDRTFPVEEVCGGFLDTCPDEKKKSELMRANKKLEELTRKLAEHGVNLPETIPHFEPVAQERLPETLRPGLRSSPYSKFSKDDLILRDLLAADRTVLANERTFLAYCRTSMALILTGAGCMKFFGGIISYITGGLLIALGLVVFAFGVYRSSTVSKDLSMIYETPPPSKHDQEPQIILYGSKNLSAAEG